MTVHKKWNDVNMVLFVLRCSQVNCNCVQIVWGEDTSWCQKCKDALFPSDFSRDSEDGSCLGNRAVGQARLDGGEWRTDRRHDWLQVREQGGESSINPNSGPRQKWVVFVPTRRGSMGQISYSVTGGQAAMDQWALICVDLYKSFGRKLSWPAGSHSIVQIWLGLNSGWPSKAARVSDSDSEILKQIVPSTNKKYMRICVICIDCQYQSLLLSILWWTSSLISWWDSLIFILIIIMILSMTTHSFRSICSSSFEQQ